jgi:hypothetical protein
VQFPWRGTADITNLIFTRGSVATDVSLHGRFEESAVVFWSNQIKKREKKSTEEEKKEIKGRDINISKIYQRTTNSQI